MSSSSPKTKVQKEILDEVLKFYERNQEEEAKKQEENISKKQYSLKAQETPDLKYEPNPAFYKVFSKLIGEPGSTQNIVQPNQEKKADEAILEVEDKPEPTHEIKQTEKHEKTQSITDSHDPPSIFERFSTRTREEAKIDPIAPETNKESNLPEETVQKEIIEKKGENQHSSTQPSIFERLSRRKKEEEPL